MISVAIDGPAGAGKSTIARKAAEALGYLYVDTGALYRAIGLHVLRAGKSTGSEDEIRSAMEGMSVELTHEEGVQHVYLNGEDVSGLIRTPEVSMAASDVSAKPAVRERLLELQRSLARTHHVIMDGRDIGTVVLPEATVKIYLTADAGVRAQRRYLELVEKGEAAEYESVLQDVIRRDENDMNRPIAPLRRADDAILVDTTNYNLEESIQLVINTVRAALAE
ncbi:MAG: (d)CMP kinase [Oscillospiraceae bacterium]|nr:(d)CMP kinase [Oscillospiraceae bacterium]